MSAGKMSYEPQLDGLRAIAVLGVLLFHLGIKGLDGGFTGVDVFFVLSGYLITSIIVRSSEAGEFSFANFYSRRVRRLVPAGLVVIALSTIGAFLLLSVEHFEAHGRAVIHATMWVPNINFWLESGYFDADKFTKPLLHFWSLGVEEQFYLFWPVIVIVGLKLSRFALFFILAALCIISFFAGCILLDTHPSAVFFLTPFRVWQFGAGGLLALLVQGLRPGQPTRHLPSWLGVPATVIGVLLIVYGFSIISEVGYPGIQALIPTAGTILVISAGANVVSKLLLSNSITRYFGKISYSLYLVHWPLIIFWRYAVNRDLLLSEQIGIGALSIALATVLYYFVETPLRKPWASSSSSENANVYARVSPFIVATVLLGSYVWAQNGWKWRLPSNALEVANQINDEDTLSCSLKEVAGFENACQFGGNANKPSVIVIGDSHARSLAHGMTRSLFNDGKSGMLFALNGTLPLKTARSYNNDVVASRDFDSVYAYALDSEADIIIIHARWALHWITRRPSGSNNLRKYVGLKGGKRPKTIKKSQTNFNKAVSRTIEELSATNKTVIIVGALPYQGANLAQCATRPTYLLSLNQILSSCGGFSRKRALSRVNDVNNILREAISDTNLIFVDPTLTLCPKGQSTCLRSIDSKIVFRDSNHLSKVGAEHLVDEALSELLPTQ